MAIILTSGGGNLPKPYGVGKDGEAKVIGVNISIKDIYENDDVVGVITRRGVNKGLNYGVGSYQPFLNQSSNVSLGVPNFTNLTVETGASLICPIRSTSASDGIVWITCIGIFKNLGTLQIPAPVGEAGENGSKRYGGYGGDGAPGAGGGGCGRGQYTSGPPGTGGQAYLLTGGTGVYWHGGDGTLGGTTDAGRGGLGGGGYGYPGSGGVGYNNNPVNFSDWRLLFGANGGGGGGGDARATETSGEISGGGGAGGGGTGGGFIYISCASFLNYGNIITDGSNGGNGGNGVWNGANGSGAGGGGGAGGIVYIDSKSYPLGLGNISVAGGVGGVGGPIGTMYGIGETGVSGGEGIIYKT